MDSTENSNEKTDRSHKELQSQIMSLETAESTDAIEARSEAEKVAADRTLAESYYRLAKVYYDKSDLDQSEKYFIKALEKSELPKDSYPVFKTYGFLIRIYSELQDGAKASTYIQKSDELVESLSDSLGSLGAEFFYNQGLAKNYQGDFSLAYQSFNLAYKKSQEENEPEVLAKSLYALAKTSFQLSDLAAAESYLEQLSQLLQILKKEYLYGNMHLLWGTISSERGELSDALHHFKLATKSLMRKNCWNLMGYIILNQGIVYKKMGEYGKALMFFELAMDSCDPSRYRRLSSLIQMEVEDVNDSNVDLYFDRQNRMIHERELGSIDFKHRFVLLEILFLLAKNPGNHYTKEDLAKNIWKEEYNPLIHDKLIYTSVSRLRKLIEPKSDSDSRRKYILRGKDGYTFNPNVKVRFHRDTSSKVVPNFGNVELSSPV